MTVLATGGTIAGSGSSGIGYEAGKVKAEDLIKAVPGIDKLARLTAEQVSSIGSQDMNETVWFALARRIDDLLGKGEAEGVVITHGTDTMEETAFFLANVLHTDKPVVLRRGADEFTADGLEYDNLERILKLQGNVHGTIAPRAPGAPG